MSHPELYPHAITSLPQGVSAALIQERLGSPDGIEVVPLTDPSAFVKPQAIYYHLDGIKRRWDAVISHASVAVLIFHTQRRAYLLVRQFRPAVYAAIVRVAAEEAAAAGAPPPQRPPLSAGFTFELCAGIVDKPGLSLTEIAREEILEETGYAVPAEKITKVTSFLTAVGISGSRQTVFAAEVDDSMLATAGQHDVAGGGLAAHGEAIEVCLLPFESVDAFLLDEKVNKSTGLMWAMQWSKDRFEKTAQH